jgi:hypothetical protein
MALLDTYKSMREYIIKYLSLKAGFYCEVSIFKRFNRIEMRVDCYDSNKPFNYFIEKLQELKVDFVIEPNRGFEDEYITLTEDEYLKLYTLCSLKNEF